MQGLPASPGITEIAEAAMDDGYHVQDVLDEEEDIFGDQAGGASDDATKAGAEAGATQGSVPSVPASSSPAPGDSPMATIEVNTALAAQFTEMGTGQSEDTEEDEAAATANAIAVDRALGGLATSHAASTAAATEVEEVVSEAASWSVVHPAASEPSNATITAAINFDAMQNLQQGLAQQLPPGSYAGAGPEAPAGAAINMDMMQHMQQGPATQPPLGTYTAVIAADVPIGTTVTAGQVVAAQWKQHPEAQGMMPASSVASEVGAQPVGSEPPAQRSNEESQQQMQQQAVQAKARLAAAKGGNLSMNDFLQGLNPNELQNLHGAGVESDAGMDVSGQAAKRPAAGATDDEPAGAQPPAKKAAAQQSPFLVFGQGQDLPSVPGKAAWGRRCRRCAARRNK